MKKHRNTSIYLSHLIACDVLPLPYFMVSDIFPKHISELLCIHPLIFHILIIHFLTHRKFAFPLLNNAVGRKKKQQCFFLDSCYFLIKVSNGFPYLHGWYSQVLLSWDFWSNWICSQSSNTMLSWHWGDILCWLMRIIYSGCGCVALSAVCFFWTYAPILRGPIGWF